MSPAPPPRPSTPRVWLAAARPRTLPAAAVPVALGTAAAFREGRADGLAAFLCLAFALLAQVAANLVNDLADAERGADTAERRGPVRVVSAGWVAPAKMRRAIALVLVLAFASGLGLVAWGGPWLILLGLASLAGAVAYTAGPYPLAYHGLGDAFVLLFFGFVAVHGTYLVQAGSFGFGSALVPALALASGLLAANLLVVNNHRDVDGDRAAGKRTLVVRLGRRFAERQYAASVLVASVSAGVVAVVARSPFPLLGLLTLPAGLRLARALAAAAPDHALLLPATARHLAVTGLLLAVGTAAAG